MGRVEKREFSVSGSARTSQSSVPRSFWCEDVEILKSDRPRLESLTTSVTFLRI